MQEFFILYVLPTLLLVGKIAGFVCVPLIISVAFLVFAERKVIAAMQLRKGPNVTGPFGLLQSFADAIKLMCKEVIIPTGSNTVIFFIAPVLTFTLAIIGWAVIPVGVGQVFANINVGLLYLLAISSLGVYGIIMAGWASNSKYAFLGSIRSTAQMISYEVSMGLILITVLLVTGSLNLTEIVMYKRPWWMCIWLFPMMIVFFISILAETNRLPFDLPEAEAELVSGYNVEYSSMGFALFFLGEYANMILTSAMMVILFMGGWLPPFGIEALSFIPGIIWFFGKVAFILFCFLWVRSSFPRYRYDQLMHLGWKVFLPLSLFWVIATAALLLFTHQLPHY